MIPRDSLEGLPPDIRELIESLTLEEIDVMRAVSKPKIMAKRSFRTETIAKHLPDKKRGIDVSSICHSLKRKRILQLYRANNWKFTNLGLRIAQFFKEWGHTRICEEFGLNRILQRGLML